MFYYQHKIKKSFFLCVRPILAKLQEQEEAYEEARKKLVETMNDEQRNEKWLEAEEGKLTASIMSYELTAMEQIQAAEGRMLDELERRIAVKAEDLENDGVRMITAGLASTHEAYAAILDKYGELAAVRNAVQGHSGEAVKDNLEQIRHAYEDWFRMAESGVSRGTANYGRMAIEADSYFYENVLRANGLDDGCLE